MSEQIQKERQKTETKEETEAVEPKDLQNIALDENVDDLLAEIDEVLEVEAEVFIKNFVQQGGEL